MSLLLMQMTHHESYKLYYRLLFAEIQSVYLDILKVLVLAN